QLDCPALAADVRVVPLGTTPSQFRPGIDPRAVRAKYGLDGGPWLLTVSRLDWHKGIDTVIKALPAVRAAVPGARYAVAGVGAVRDGETGILVDPDDAGAVAHGITRLLDDAELRRRMGAAGRRAVETYYNWDRVARDLMEIDREFRRPDR